MNNVNLKNALLEVQTNSWISKVAKQYNISESQVKDLYETNLVSIEEALVILNEEGAAKSIAKNLQGTSFGNLANDALNYILRRKPKDAAAADPAAAARDKTIDDLAAGAGATRAGDASKFRQAEADSMKKLDDMKAADDAAKTATKRAEDNQLFRKGEADSMKKLDDMKTQETASKRAEDNQLFRKGEADSMAKLKAVKDAELKAVKDAELQTQRMKAREPAEIAPPKGTKLTQNAKLATAVGLTGLAGYGVYKATQGDDKQTAAAEPPKAAEAPSKKDEFKFTDDEKKGKVSVDRLKSWATHVGIEKPEEASWSKYGRNFMNDARKEGGTLSMRNAPKPTESQKKGEASVKKAYGLGESLLAAFNDVVNSKSPNLFAEAAKKNASEPKTEKEKKLAALAEPKDKITHKDVLVGRGVVKEEEQIDEAAFKLTDAHKNVITTHLNKNIGKGKVTFDSEDGGHFATHSDGIQSTVHHVQMKNGKLSLSHFMTMDEEVGFSEAEHSLGHQTAEAIHHWSNHLQYNNNGSKARGILKAVKKKHGPEVAKDFEQTVVNASENLTGSGEADKSDHVMKHFTPQDHADFNARMKHRKTDVKDAIVTKSIGEEVGFSEAELAHIASIVEGMPVAPTPEDQAPTPSPKNKAEGGKGKGSLAEVKSENEKEEKAESKLTKGTANELHMNVKKAADNMSNVKHKFANGETVNMTKGMAVGFLNRHSSAKTADQKDAILKHANKSFDAFKHITQGGAVPKEEEAPKIKLGTMKGK